ncbi:hypothetical protein [Brevundimonas sp.]|uniref:hypothetical protein n=1 Tax=Brevundimonas sp. TaxID=1871086 RepID=UPI00262DFD4A|nr:hypothetical protein [Brevundimonas sp.]
MAAGEKVDPAAAWAASSAAVRMLMGAPPPLTAGVTRGGRRSDPATAWRRKLAIYTAVVGLGAGVKPMRRFMGVQHSAAYEVLHRMEEARDTPAIDQLLDLLKAEAERQLAKPSKAAA